jgi:tetratricopeptide (TPR) repeat protein
MNTLSDILNTFRENVRSVVAVMAIALLLVVIIIFAATTLLPRWQLRAELENRLDTVKGAILSDTQIGLSGGDQQAQLDQAATQLNEAAALFLTESQAGELLNNLNQYALESGVQLVDLQAQPATQNTEKLVYDLRRFGIQATGSLPQLMDFVVRVRETAVSTVNLINLNLTGDETTGGLTADLLLYTSLYATGDAFANLPEHLLPTPLPQPTSPANQLSSADAIFTQIHEPWRAETWPTVITLLEQLLVLDSAYPEASEKLYAAYVNYGHQLNAAGQKSAARAAFENALTIQPDGGEALLGLQAAADATPTVTTYSVVRGDTLFSISRRYGVSVDALRLANGLVGNAISPGQILTIPQP